MKCCENPLLRRSKMPGVKAAHGNGLMDPRSGWGRVASSCSHVPPRRPALLGAVSIVWTSIPALQVPTS